MPESTSTLVPSELKVVELRKELANRNLSTKGKKQELIERLEEALKKESAAGEEQPSTAEAVQTEPAPQPEPEAKPEDQAPVQQMMDVEPATDATIAAEIPPAPAADTEQKGSAEAPGNIGREAETERSATVESIPDESEAPAKPLADTHLETQQELAKNAESEAPKSPVVEEPESTLGGVGTEPGQAAPTADGGPAVTIETPGETGREVPDLKRKAEDDGVGEEAEAAKSVKLENNGTPVKVIEDSTTDSDKVGVYIKNLVRPLMAQQVEELLGKYGACKEVWLNSIKSRCYAEFETPEQAKTAVENIDGTTFPEKTGRKVACGHLSKGKMHELVDLEERARSDGKTLDLIDKNGEVFLVCENGSKYCPDKPKNGGESEADEGSDSLANKDASNLSSVPIDSLYMKTKARPHLYYKPNSVGEKGEEAAATSPMHRSPGYDE